MLGNVHTHHPGSLSIFNPNFDSDNAEQSACFQEVVSRTQTTNCIGNPSGKKCEVNGDGLCDTAADPNTATERSGSVLLKGVSNAPGCVYSVPNYDNRYKRDRNNVLWDPPVHNIMSYANNTCQDEFSNGQIAIMWDRIETRFKDYFEGDFSGASLICTSGGTVNFNNPPPGVDISWTATPSSFFHSSTRTGSGVSAFVKARNSSVSGWGTISFHESDDCEFFSTSYKVWVGKPSAPQTTPSGVPAVETGLGSYVTIRIDEIPGMIGLSNVSWYTNNSNALGLSPGSMNCTVECLQTGYNSVYVYATNSCGQGFNQQIPFNVTSGGGGGPCCPYPQIVINPNPSPEEVNITFSNIEEIEDYYGKDQVTYQLHITDLSGNEKYRGVINKQGLRLNMRHAQKGIYVVSVLNKDTETHARLVIE